MIPLKSVPKPDLLIEYPDGSVVPMMLHFAAEGADLRQIAEEQGFDLTWRELDEEAHPELYRAYFEDGADDVVKRWHPVAPDGWKFAGKWDTEDGPTAYFIRPVSK